MRPLVFALPGNKAFVRLLLPALACEPGELETRRFPDGESYLRVDTPVHGRPTLVVCTLARPDDQILPLLFLAATLRERGATSVGLVAPYLAYMRQDTEFQQGEAVTARHFARLVSSAFDWLVTADPHLHRIAALEAVYRSPARAVHTAPRLSAWIRDDVPKPVVIGPDAESEQWVAAIARDGSAPYLVFEKTRHGDRDVELKLPALRVARERTPVVVDDIISSAHTQLYLAFASPWVRAAATPWSAALLKWMHPMRASRYLFSERFNPWMAGVGAVAALTRTQRRPAGEGNGFLAIEHEASRQVGEALERFRKVRDATYEAAFRGWFS